MIEAAMATLPSHPVAAALPDVQNQEEARRLAEAFQMFNQASEELSTAYTALQSQVVELTQELAAANGALRKQYQENLALTERLASLLDALPAGVVLVGADDRVLQTNPAAELVLGKPLEGGLWADLFAENFSHGSVAGEYRVQDRHVAMTVTAVDSGGGHIVLLHDVSETHELKEQAERNQRLAAMGEMAAQLAHQLRTPLAAALLYTGNLELPEVADEMRISIAGKAVSRLKHLERLIQDMLLFARGEVLGREAIVLRDLLNEIRHTFEPLARARQIVFVAGTAAPGVQFKGNRKALTGALTNLLENALDAVTANGQVTLAADVTGLNIDFIVEDNGRGVSPEMLGRLFEPFFTTRSEGTGLGLAIARGVARAHGGGIEVSSTPGQGTRFVMSIATGIDTHE